MAIIVFQHSPHGVPGRLGLTLRDHARVLDIRRLDLPPEQGGGIPPDYDGVEAVVSLGGPQNVGESHPWLAREMDYLRGAHQRALPVVGICLGAQLIAAALGGSVEKMPAPEVGFTKVTIGPSAHTDALLAGIPWESMQFQAHGRQITALPAGAALLASSAACKVQAFRAGMRTYGFQYHFEADRAHLETLLDSPAGREMLRDAGRSRDAVLADADVHYPMFARLADRLCVNIASLLLPLQWRTTRSGGARVRGGWAI